MSKKMPTPPVTDVVTDNSGRALILRTAACLFRNNGYAATSLRQIAAACDMKAGSLYYHFASKDDITAEVLRIGVAQVFDEVRRVTAELGDAAEPRELIRMAVLTHLKALHEAIDFSSANIRIFGQVPREIRLKHMPLRKEYESFWLQLLERCKAAGAFDDTRNLARASFLLLGMMNSTLDWFHADKLSIDDLATEITDMFFYGLAARN